MAAREATIIRVGNDELLEQAIKSRAAAAAASEILEGRLIYVATVLGALCIGIVFGWAPLATILETDGVYASACAGAGTCDEQHVGISVLYTAASGGLLFGGLPAGMFADAYGAVPTCILSGTFIMLGSLGLALLPPDADALFIFPLVLLGSGGMLSFFTCARVAHMYPKDETLIFTMINVLFDASAGLPLLFYLLYDGLGASRATVFSGYAVYAAGLYAAWCMLFLRHQRRAAAKPAVEAELAPPSDAEHASAPPSSPAESIAPLEPSCSIREAMTSPPFLLGVTWFLLNALHSNTYLGVAKYMLVYLGDASGTYMQIYTASLSAAVPFIPAISHTIERVGIANSMHLVSAMAAAHALLALVPSLPVQLLTFTVFTVYRAATFAVYSVFLTRTFGIAKLGRLLGSSNGIGAMQNSLFIPAVSQYVMLQLGGDWSVVTAAFLLFVVPQYLCVRAMTSAPKGGALV